MLQALPATQNLIDRVYQQLLEAIADGTLLPGQRIRQAELAENLGVSRQPVSHALHLLKRQGLGRGKRRQGVARRAAGSIACDATLSGAGGVDGLAARLAAGQVAVGSG